MGIDLLGKELDLGQVFFRFLFLDADHLLLDGVIHAVDGLVQFSDFIVSLKFDPLSITVFLDLVNHFHEPVYRPGDGAGHKKRDSEKDNQNYQKD